MLEHDGTEVLSSRARTPAGTGAPGGITLGIDADLSVMPFRADAPNGATDLRIPRFVLTENPAWCAFWRVAELGGGATAVADGCRIKTWWRALLLVPCLREDLLK